jgi:hypothetical protein
MNVSGKHLNAPTQFKLIVKKESVGTYGVVSAVVVSGLGARTRQVQQHPSTCSHLNTVLVEVAPFKV